MLGSCLTVRLTFPSWLRTERAALGYEATVPRLEGLLRTCHPSNRRAVVVRISSARDCEGLTLFDEIVDIIRDHGPGGREPEDGVLLELAQVGRRTQALPVRVARQQQMSTPRCGRRREQLQFRRRQWQADRRCLAPARQLEMLGFFPRCIALRDLSGSPGRKPVERDAGGPALSRHDGRAEVP
jgi:hypothetical protein